MNLRNSAFFSLFKSRNSSSPCSQNDQNPLVSTPLLQATSKVWNWFHYLVRLLVTVTHAGMVICFLWFSCHAGGWLYIKKFFKKLFSDMSWNNITPVGLLAAIGNWRMRDRGLGLASAVVEICWNDNVRIAIETERNAIVAYGHKKLNIALK